MNHKVHGACSFWHTAPRRFPKSVLLSAEPTESEIITGTSESVTKLFRKYYCFWEAYEYKKIQSYLLFKCLFPVDLIC